VSIFKPSTLAEAGLSTATDIGSTCFDDQLREPIRAGATSAKQVVYIKGGSGSHVSLHRADPHGQCHGNTAILIVEAGMKSSATSPGNGLVV